jgi:DNA-binding MarR family transcriptional regulator
MDINEFARGLELFRSVDSEMGVQTMLCFLFVAQRGTVSQKDVEVSLGVTNAGASRNISYWTDRRFDRRPGKGFIERVEDDYDRRFRTLSLTPKGRAFYERLRGTNGKEARK